MKNIKNLRRSKDRLIWIDLEMSGLDPDKDKILEIATLITDNNLNIIAKGPNLVINQPAEIINTMDEWNTEQHGSTGLSKQVLNSKISITQAEKDTLEFLKIYCVSEKAPLCGSSIGQDKAFLYRYMPKIYSFLNYRIIDVSSIKEVVKRWYPESSKTKFKKKDSHRALDDIYESIEELRYYREHFFKAELAKDRLY